MRNSDKWKPSKFKIKNGKLSPSLSLNVASIRMAEYIADFYNYTIPKYAKGNLLDMGCGTVPMYSYYKEKVSSVTCIDWKNSFHEQIHVDYFCDLNERLPIEDDSFDVIICSDVLEHLKVASIAVSEMNRILKKGGVALINFPFLYGLHEEPYDFGRYTKHQVKTWAETNNLEVLECIPYGSLIDMFEHSSIRLLKLLPMGQYLGILLKKMGIPIIKRFLKQRIDLDNKHPYMYGFVLQKTK